MALGVAVKELIHVPHVAYADRHEAQVAARVRKKVGVHVDERVFRKEHCLRLDPSVALALQLPVFAGSDDIVGIVGVEGLVAPVVDIEGEAGKCRITYGCVVDSEAVVDELAYPSGGTFRHRVTRIALRMTLHTHDH